MKCDIGIVNNYIAYNPVTGLFFWKLPRGRAKAGDRAGYFATDQGYRYIRISGEAIAEHRLAFLMMTGNAPNGWVDHKNGIVSDNRWLNLRDCTPSQNQFNRKASKANKSGIKGVTWDPLRSKWRARIRLYGKEFHLGRFNTLESASKAYEKAAKSAHGDFFRGSA